jgi:hypothetical protein
MEEKEFWELLGGKEMLMMMADAENFRFYNKIGKYKYLMCSGDFIMDEYRICMSIYDFCNTITAYKVLILPKGGKRPNSSSQTLWGFTGPEGIIPWLEKKCEKILRF